MSARFSFDVTCPRCGGELLPEGYRPQRSAPDEIHHDARCDHCLDVLRITVTTTVVEAWPVDRTDPAARGMEAACDADQILTAGSLR